MTGYPEFNHPAFHHWADILRRKGFSVINPAELDEEQGLLKSTSDYYARDLPYVAQADMGAAMPGWRASTGAKTEAYLLGNFLHRPVLSLPTMEVIPQDQLPTLSLAVGGMEPNSNRFHS